MLQFDDTPVTRQGPVQWAMINNDVLRSVRYSLDLGDHHVVTLCQMADPAFAVDPEQVKAWLRREDEATPDADDAFHGRFGGLQVE